MKNYVRRITNLENFMPIEGITRVELIYDDNGRPCDVRLRVYDSEGNVIKDRGSNLAELVKYETGRDS